MFNKGGARCLEECFFSQVLDPPYMRRGGGRGGIISYSVNKFENLNDI
jgi:hypothetical protein